MMTKEKTDLFKQALVDFIKLPGEVSGAYDPWHHTDINQLLWSTLHELDLVNEQPEEYDYLSKKKFAELKTSCKRYIRKYREHCSIPEEKKSYDKI
jgi:hypothetical protein